MQNNFRKTNILRIKEIRKIEKSGEKDFVIEPNLQNLDSSGQNFYQSK